MSRSWSGSELLEIWFGRLLLGHLDPQELDFLRSEEAS